VNAERLVVLGWSRAILMQFAHPLIAAGVHDHSGFRASPIAAVRRLRQTVGAMLALTFGDRAQRTRAVEGIRAIHRRVNGALPETIGPYTAGTRYSAEDPALVRWVHLTLLESVIIVYEQFVAPLTPQERDDYCRESAWVPIALGARSEELPRSWESLVDALAEEYRSGRIVVSPVARELSRALLYPRGAAIAGPSMWANRLVTVGLLPPHVREDYGFVWSPRSEQALRHVTWLLRIARRLLPPVITQWRDARRLRLNGSRHPEVVDACGRAL
jgi:uncharacterized protein (DUF2236 family)